MGPTGVPLRLFVFDILHNNTTDIQPKRHSTDTHGTNQVNFLLLFFDGHQFAPRYRDLHKRMSGLVGCHRMRRAISYVNSASSE
jgi:TnpA family transposase